MNRKRSADEALPEAPDKRPFISTEPGVLDGDVRATSSPIMDVPLSDFARISPAMRSPYSKKPSSRAAEPISASIVSGTGSGLRAAIMSPRINRRARGGAMSSPAINSKSRLLVPEIEEYSRLRLRSRKVPALSLRHYMDQKTFYSIPNVVHSQKKNVVNFAQENWVTIGVVASISSYITDDQTKTPYFSFTFTATTDHTLRVFLVTKEAIDRWQNSLKFGDVIGILNPAVLKPGDPNALLGLQIHDGNQILPVGTSFDIVRCKYVNGKGEQCKRIVKRSSSSMTPDNMPQQEHCHSHLLRQLQASQRRRQELVTGTNGGFSCDDSKPQLSSSLPSNFLVACHSKNSRSHGSSVKISAKHQQTVYTRDDGQKITVSREVPLSTNDSDAAKPLIQDNDKVIDILCRQPNAGGKYLRAASGLSHAFASPSGVRKAQSSDVFSAKDLQKMGFHPSHKSHLGVPPLSPDAVGDGMELCSPMKSPSKYATINQSHILSPSAMRRGPSLGALGNVAGRRLFGAGGVGGREKHPSSHKSLFGASAAPSGNPFVVSAPVTNENASDDVSMCSPFTAKKPAAKQPVFVDLESSGDEAEDMIVRISSKPQCK